LTHKLFNEFDASISSKKIDHLFTHLMRVVALTNNLPVHLSAARHCIITNAKFNLKILPQLPGANYCQK
jgi:hypothetical protein